METYKAIGKKFAFEILQEMIKANSEGLRLKKIVFDITRSPRTAQTRVNEFVKLGLAEKREVSKREVYYKITPRGKSVYNCAKQMENSHPPSST